MFPFVLLREIETVKDVGYALLSVSFTIALLSWLVGWYQPAVQRQWVWFIIIGLCVAVSWFTQGYLLLDVLEENSAMMAIKILSGDLGVIAVLVFARVKVHL